MKCEFGCKSELEKISSPTLPLFRSLDYSSLKRSLEYYFCHNCETIFNYKNFFNEEKLFLSDKFIKSKKTISELNNDKKKKLFRYQMQADLLSKYLKRNNLNILDYGCFDGKLLIELSKKIKNSNFFGIEKSKEFKKIFPKEKNFFFETDLKKIDEKFDIIIFSETIYYIKDIDKILNLAYHKLKDNGYLYIQTTDLDKNPYYFLSGDQFFFQFPHTIKFLLNKNNFEVLKKKFNFFKKQKIYLCRKNKKLKYKKKKINFFHKIVKLVSFLENKVKLIKNQKIKYLFGTTINAAFADEILKSSSINFIDENKDKVLNGFRSKKVITPSKVDKSQKILLNYHKHNSLYDKILKKKYYLKTKII